MKQILLPIIGTVIFIFLVGMFVSNPGKYIKNQPVKSIQNIVKINGVDIQVSIADSNDERAKGLSNTSSLGEKEGMFFVFDKKDIKPSFWMKDMLISIDIIWIDNDKIVQIDKNLMPLQEETSDKLITTYSPQIPIDYVLEVNSGFSDKYNLKVSDNVDLTSLNLN